MSERNLSPEEKKELQADRQRKVSTGQKIDK